MTIARDIVRLHGSELHIRSSRGSGTTFMFGLRNAGSDA